ncbi:ring finger domain-containing protein [Colletotrichum scovillei]|uniref:RING-type E3 ubiquitin transferase n=1 Tax=Colletotrichum scovillei TaxID=1209932 RepID=A0A9P7QPV4_9PEZI|nr:ring finger domain-containing protein [Colletotrichum scovillei]KAG7040790.1 ring finger domain-containing protein [Colletotrichum scovillei]KAG7060834.1 ring finger domain-containing protein [Colletotrichum scovillei]
MDSHAPRGGHLVATDGREVVYCHACSHEWWQDEHGLQCPRCESEITEIVSPENDPREIEDGPPLHDSPRLRRHIYDDDSDPEEADIEEHLHRGPGGFVVHRAIWDNSQRPGQSPNPNTRQPPDVNDGDQIIRRFIDMVNDFGMGMPPRPPDETRPPGFGTGGNIFGGQGNVRTFQRTGPGGTTSFTIATGPIHVHQGGANSPAGAGGDPFQSIFSSVLAGAGPPQPAGMGPGQGQRAPNQAPTLLHEILNMLNPANASHGDAVYTQEALDRIISQLMEQNPASNAAPPATEDALSKLKRKKVDKEMLGPDGKTECTICIDDFKEGDDATVLPCKHWFHDQCVVMWLKEHNTCPICRTPIEEPSGGSSSNDNNNNNNANASGSSNGGNDNNNSSQPHPGAAAPGSSESHQDSFWPGNDPGHWANSMRGIPPRSSYMDTTPPVPADSTRPQSSFVDEVYGRYGASSTGRSDPQRPQETSRMPSFRSARRDSHSPPSLRRHQSDVFRARQRSPSSGNWDRGQDSNQDNNQDAGSNHGPLNWLRNQFSRGSGSGDSNPRERRRQ